MAWPKGKKRGPVAEGNAAFQQDDVPPAPVLPADAPTDYEGFAAWVQRLRLPAVVVSLSHPDATDRHMDGMFSGFAQSKGPAAAKWSDGSCYP